MNKQQRKQVAIAFKKCIPLIENRLQLYICDALDHLRNKMIISKMTCYQAKQIIDVRLDGASSYGQWLYYQDKKIWDRAVHCGIRHGRVAWLKSLAKEFSK